MLNNLKPSSNAFDLVQNAEGCQLTAYRDAGGVWTIGYGHTLGVYEGQTISQSQAIQFLSDDLQDAADRVNDLVTVDLTQNQFDALTDWVFNLGAKNLQDSRLLSYVNQGYFSLAANEFQKWNHANGIVLAGLTARRLAEKELFTAT